MKRPYGKTLFVQWYQKKKQRFKVCDLS